MPEGKNHDIERSHPRRWSKISIREIETSTLKEMKAELDEVYGTSAPLFKTVYTEKSKP